MTSVSNVSHNPLNSQKDSSAKMDPALFSVEASEGVKAVALVQLTCQYDLLSQPPLPISFEFIDDLQFRLDVLSGECIYFMIGREKDADEQWQLRIQAAIR